MNIAKMAVIAALLCGFAAEPVEGKVGEVRIPPNTFTQTQRDELGTLILKPKGSEDK